MFGHGGWGGKMITSGLESVLISHPVHGNHNAFGIGEGVASFGYSSDIFSGLTDLFLGSALFDFSAVLAFESVSPHNYNDSSVLCFILDIQSGQ